MQALVGPSLVLCASVCTAAVAVAQTPVGTLPIDERRGDQCGWAVDFETDAAAREMALQECGSGCSVVLKFGRWAVFAADRAADSTAVGRAEPYDSAIDARQAVLIECQCHGGSGCGPPAVNPIGLRTEDFGLVAVLLRQNTWVLAAGADQ